MNSVYSLEKSSNGLLWVGTPGGLQRFDGYGFDNWDQSADSTKKTGLSVYHIREDGKEYLGLQYRQCVCFPTRGKNLSGSTLHYNNPFKR